MLKTIKLTIKMEQDVDDGYRSICGACLSTDRNLVPIYGISEIIEVFELLMYNNYVGDRIVESELILKQLLCWECLAIMKKIAKFKKQVQNAQEHLRVVSLGSPLEAMDHTYLSQSLSSLECVIKPDYDRMYIDYTQEIPVVTENWPQQYIVANQLKPQQYDVAQTLHDSLTLDIEDRILGMPEMVVENPMTGVMPHIVEGDSILEETLSMNQVKGEFPELNLESSPVPLPRASSPTPVGDETPPVAPPSPASCWVPSPAISTTSMGTVMIKQPKTKIKDDDKLKSGYVAEYLCDADMLALREEDKKKVQYASAVYKCELCIIGFYNQQQVEDHFLAAHRPRPGYVACRVCYVYLESSKLLSHQTSHHLVYKCCLCNRSERTSKAIAHHMSCHLSRQQSTGPIKICDTATLKKNRKVQKETQMAPPKSDDLKKLLSKTTIVGYKCLECDMFFKNSRMRKTHVARCHREGLQCDHCKKRFVNRTTLITHLRLHEGPLPREKCPICDKMVQKIQLKYHIRRHQSAKRYECKECDKVFSYLNTYQAHLKYSRRHASQEVFKFPCPMCNKGYSTKKYMQDHFNYQHLGKTTYKCPVCDKPIATKATVMRHMMRVHGEKKEKPRTHVCQHCGKGFTSKKMLTEHVAIHSAARPLACDICQHTFKQRAALYTHRKLVHKVTPAKRQVEFMDQKEA